MAKTFIKPKFRKLSFFCESSMPLEVDVITDTSRASSVPETISQYKAEHQSFLWKESEERRGSAGITFSVLLL